LSPFWRSIKELRLIKYQSSPLEPALKNILNGNFQFHEESNNLAFVGASGVAIRKTSSADTLQKSTGPDHLLRLFAYNSILRKIGANYFEKEKFEEVWSREAEEAFVLTPVSSLIVLETQKDYDDNGIKKNKNTVGNASLKGGGAVPEPHEWLLIGLVLVLVIIHFFRKWLPVGL
jgi:XrtN system VIT domain protein